MIDIKIAQQSFLYALAVVLYITFVATIMSFAEQFLSQREDTILAPISFLLLFVVSAAMMAVLVFGKPVMLYLDGKKRDGVLMTANTIGFLAIFTIILLIVQSFI